MFFKSLILNWPGPYILSFSYGDLQKSGVGNNVVFVLVCVFVFVLLGEKKGKRWGSGMNGGGRQVSLRIEDFIKKKKKKKKKKLRIEENSIIRSLG